MEFMQKLTNFVRMTNMVIYIAMHHESFRYVRFHRLIEIQLNNYGGSIAISIVLYTPSLYIPYEAWVQYITNHPAVALDDIPF